MTKTELSIITACAHEGTIFLDKPTAKTLIRLIYDFSIEGTTIAVTAGYGQLVNVKFDTVLRLGPLPDEYLSRQQIADLAGIPLEA